MDERLRRLERRFFQEGSIELGLRYYPLLFHLGGLGETLTGVIEEMVGRPHDRLRGEITGGEFISLVYGVLWPQYTITVTVLTRSPIRCRCGAAGDHRHSRPEMHLQLPGSLRAFRLDEPLREYTQPAVLLNYEQPYRYHLSHWQFTTQPPEENDPEAFWANDNWYLRRIWLHNDSITDTRLPIDDVGRYTNQIPFRWFNWSPSNRYHRYGYRELFDNRDTIQLVREHQLPPQPPHLVIETCEDFRILPKGSTIFIPGYGHLPTGGTVTVMGGPVMQTEMVIDTSTTCGHGFIDMPDGIIFPLCPPGWSDTGETAGSYCEMCLKILPIQPEARALTRFNICNECVNKMSNQSRLEEIADYRDEDETMTSIYCDTCSEQLSEEEEVDDNGKCIYCDEPVEQYYDCLFCRQSQETPQEATEHCTRIIPIDYRELLP